MNIQTQTAPIEENGRHPKAATQVRQRRQVTVLLVIAHLAAWVPLAVLVADGLAGNLTENPI